MLRCESTSCAVTETKTAGLCPIGEARMEQLTLEKRQKKTPQEIPGRIKNVYIEVDQAFAT